MISAESDKASRELARIAVGDLTYDLEMVGLIAVIETGKTHQ